MGLSLENASQAEAVAQLVARARSVLFITGAGISADSGLPTYRGVGGLYEGVTTEDGIEIETALSGPFFREYPEITWKYLHQVEQACRDARPNRGHGVISQLDARCERVWTFTQNVDGLHRAAGSANVIDIHGDVHVLICTRCDFRETVKDYSHLAPLPKCPKCDSVIRPDVVLFEELLPMQKLERFQEEFALGFDVVFSVGTSSLFPYIIEPVIQARSLGIPTVEINPGETEVSDMVDHRIRAGAAESLDAVWQSLNRTPG